MLPGLARVSLAGRSNSPPRFVSSLPALAADSYPRRLSGVVTTGESFMLPDNYRIRLLALGYEAIIPGTAVYPRRCHARRTRRPPQVFPQGQFVAVAKRHTGAVAGVPSPYACYRTFIDDSWDVLTSGGRSITPRGARFAARHHGAPAISTSARAP